MTDLPRAPMRLKRIIFAIKGPVQTESNIQLNSMVLHKNFPLINLRHIIYQMVNNDSKIKIFIQVNNTRSNDQTESIVEKQKKNSFIFNAVKLYNLSKFLHGHKF